MPSLFLLLLLCSAGLDSVAGEELEIPDCISKEKLAEMSESESEDFPRCFCSLSTYRLDLVNETDPKLVHIECSLIPFVANLTSAIKAVMSAGYTVDTLDLQGFNFDPDVGLPAGYFEDLGVNKLRQLKLVIYSSKYTDGIDVCEREAVSMEAGALRGLEDSLHMISVTECFMPVIPAAFQNLTALEVLHLQTSGTDALLEDSFLGMDNLKELDVGRNRLLYFESGTFKPLQNLVNLTLGPRNDFNGTIYAELNNIGPSLKYLNMRNLDLRSDDTDGEILFPDSFANLTGLEELHLSLNYITTIVWGAFKGLENLKHLDMRVNYLNEIDGNAFIHTPSLERLDLSGNYLTEIGNFTFDGLYNLQYLGLSHQEFESLGPGIFQHLESVQTLTVGGTSKLKELHEDTFYGLRTLKTLNLSTTAVEKLPHQSLVWVPELLTLDLYNSSLAFLEVEDFEGVPFLRTLNLSNTYLQSIPVGTLEPLEDLELLDISKNAWICDDRMGAVIKDVRRRYGVAAEAGRTFVLQNADSTACYRPWPLSGQSLMEQDPVKLVFWDEAKDTTTAAATTTTTTKATTTTQAPSTTAPKTTTELKAVTREALPDLNSALNGAPTFDGDKKEADSKRGSVGIIVAVIVAALVTILFIAVVLMTLRKRKQQQKEAQEAAAHGHAGVENGKTNGGYSYDGSAVYTKEAPNGVNGSVELKQAPNGKDHSDSAIVRTQEPND